MRRLSSSLSDRNWLEFLAVLDATFTGSDVASNVKKSAELFEKVAAQDGPKDRTGLLALLDLENRARDAGVSAGMPKLIYQECSTTNFLSDPNHLNELLERYFDAVGDKACCFEDLKPYITGLEGEHQSRWSSYLEKVPVVLVSHSQLTALNVA